MIIFSLFYFRITPTEKVLSKSKNSLQLTTDTYQCRELKKELLQELIHSIEIKGLRAEHRATTIHAVIAKRV